MWLVYAQFMFQQWVTEKTPTPYKRNSLRYGVATTDPKIISGPLLERPRLVCEGVEPMGRGRAKAKQTKVARELKYSSPNTDFEALQRELTKSEQDERDRENAGELDEYE